MLSMTLILILVMWNLMGSILSIFYVKAFILFGIPGERKWMSLMWRLVLMPSFWPLVVFIDLHYDETKLDEDLK